MVDNQPLLWTGPRRVGMLLFLRRPARRVAGHRALRYLAEARLTMAYTEDIARPLIDTLARMAGLPTFQLAGHVPNLAFWMAEVRHALSVIDGYHDRHTAMVAAQVEYDQNYPEAAKAREHHDYDYQPTRQAVSPAFAERLSRDLASAAERLIQRCLREGLVDIVTADDLRAASGRGTPAAR